MARRWLLSCWQHAGMENVGRSSLDYQALRPVTAASEYHLAFKDRVPDDPCRWLARETPTGGLAGLTPVGLQDKLEINPDLPSIGMILASHDDRAVRWVALADDRRAGCWIIPVTIG